MKMNAYYHALKEPYQVKLRIAVKLARKMKFGLMVSALKIVQLKKNLKQKMEKFFQIIISAFKNVRSRTTKIKI